MRGMRGGARGASLVYLTYSPVCNAHEGMSNVTGCVGGTFGGYGDH